VLTTAAELDLDVLLLTATTLVDESA